MIDERSGFSSAAAADAAAPAASLLLDPRRAFAIVEVGAGSAALFGRTDDAALIGKTLAALHASGVSGAQHGADVVLAPLLHAAAAGRPQLDSDPLALQQVLGHLLDNVRLHACATSVRVEARPDPDGGQLELSVADDGVGIAAADLERVFDPFFTTRFGTGGCGLGLYIAHNPATGPLGGRIALASETGQGTRVSLVLPLSRRPVETV